MCVCVCVCVCVYGWCASHVYVCMRCSYLMIKLIYLMIALTTAILSQLLKSGLAYWIYHSNLIKTVHICIDKDLCAQRSIKLHPLHTHGALQNTPCKHMWLSLSIITYTHTRGHNKIIRLALSPQNLWSALSSLFGFGNPTTVATQSCHSHASLM